MAWASGRLLLPATSFITRDTPLARKGLAKTNTSALLTARSHSVNRRMCKPRTFRARRSASTRRAGSSLLCLSFDRLLQELGDLGCSSARGLIGYVAPGTIQAARGNLVVLDHGLFHRLA